MVTITAEAEKFIDELLEKNQKVGWGIKVYLSGYACSGPQFGMSFQQGAKEGEKIDNSAKSFEFMFHRGHRVTSSHDIIKQDNHFPIKERSVIRVLRTICSAQM